MPIQPPPTLEELETHSVVSPENWLAARKELLAELHGLSVFYKRKDGSIYHTYSTYARGVETLVSTLQFLDLVPKGRNESRTMSWIRLHDKYDAASSGSDCCGIH